MSDPTDENEGTTETNRYADERSVGRGSMGEVAVVHDRVLGRDVARKRLRSGREQVLKRFLRERRITAQLEHPSIVPVHDAGVGDDGRPYYTMKYLRGTELKAAIAAAHTMPERLGLIPVFASICQAVAYAHSRGVIHRDLKPSNVMLGSFGEAVVVDWGLARFLDDDGDEGGDSLDLGDTIETQFGRVTGTPSYMPPEQARGEPVDRRSDVYALGAVLYQILTGDPPHGRGAIETVLARAAAGAVPSLHQVAPDAPGELVAIAERCLAADPEARYPDAGALAEDVNHWLSGLPVDAYRYSRWERLRRYTGRNWRWLLPTTLGLLGIALASAVGVVNVRQQRDLARANEEQALAARDTAEQALASALAERARLAARIEDGLSAQVLAAEALTHAPSPEARGVLAGHWSSPNPQLVTVVEAPHPCPGLAFVGSDLLCSGSGQTSLVRQDGSVVWSTPVSGYRITVEGGEAVLGGHETHVLDLSDGRILRSTEAEGAVRAGGTWLERDRYQVRWDDHQLNSAGGLARLRTVDDQAWLFALSGRNWRFDGDRWQEQEDVKMVTLDLAGDDRWFAVSGTEVRVRPIDQMRWTALPLESEVYQVEVGPEVLLGGAVDHSVYVWEIGSWERIGRLPDHGGTFASVAIGPDNTWATSGGAEIRLWERSHQPPQRTFVARSHSVVSAPGEPIWICKNDGTLLSAPPGSRAFTPIEHEPLGRCVDCAGRGNELVVLFQDKVLVRGPTGSQLFTTARQAIAVEKAGDRVFTIHPQTSRIWTRDGQQLDGTRVLGSMAETAVLAREGEVYGIDGDDETVFRRPLQPGWTPIALLEGRLLLQDLLGNLQLEDLHPTAPGSAPIPLVGHEAAATVGILAEQNDRRYLITGGWDHLLMVWDFDTGTLLAKMDGHDARILDLAWDGRFVWSTSFDQTVRSWDLSVLDLAPEALIGELRRRSGLAVRDGSVAFVGPE